MDKMKTYEEGEELLTDRGLIVLNLSQKLKDFFKDVEIYPPHYLCLNLEEGDDLPSIFFADFKSRTFREKYEDFSLEERQVVGYKFFRDMLEVPVLVFVKNKESEDWFFSKVSDLTEEGEASLMREEKKPLYYFKVDSLEKVE